MELDSHADTSVLGKNFAVLEYTNTSCDVYGFSGTSKLADVPIVSGATAWNDENGTTFILVIHHALWNYTDLSSIPTLVYDYNELNNEPALTTVATTGSYNDLLNLPADLSSIDGIGDVDTTTDPLSTGQLLQWSVETDAFILALAS